MDFDFASAFIEVTFSLQKLLNMKFLPGNSDCESTLGLVFDGILKYHESRNIRGRDVQLLRMLLFEKNLTEIRDYDKKMFNRYKKSIIKSRNIDGFFGIAPTLHSFLNSDIVRVYGVCDEVIFEEV